MKPWGNFVKCMALAFLTVTLFVQGCFNKSFQPNPPIFMMWSKAEASSDQAKQALIDCGFHNAGTGSDVGDMRTGKIGSDEFVRAEICMEKKGFKNGSGKSTCSYPSNDHLSACQEY